MRGDLINRRPVKLAIAMIVSTWLLYFIFGATIKIVFDNRTHVVIAILIPCLIFWAGIIGYLTTMLWDWALK